MLKNCEHIQVSLYKPPEIKLTTDNSDCGIIELKKPEQFAVNCSGVGRVGLSEVEVSLLIESKIHANASDEGVQIDHLGNIRLTFGALPQLP